MTAFSLGFHAAAAALFVLAAAGAQAEDGPVTINAEPVPLSAEDADAETVGRLAYRGGLVLESEEPRLGGVSGLRWLGGNRFLAITDQGDWLRLDTAETDGRLTGIAAAHIGILADERGAPLLVKPLADAEALTVQTRDGTPVAATVYFERSHRAWRYKLDENGHVGAFARDLPLGDWAGDLPDNAGIEAVAATPAGLFLIPEGGRLEDGRVRAPRQWRADGRLRTAPIAFDLPEGFRPTDAHGLPGGAILLLSRRFSPLQGVAARLDLLDFQPSPRGPGRLKRTPLALLEAPVSVDNMEALAVRKAGDRTLIYLMSDDNFSPMQRTLLMKFELLPPNTAPAEKQTNTAPAEGAAPPESAGTTPEG